MKKIFIFSLVALFGASAVAATEYAGKIKGFYINKHKVALLKLDIDTPDCGDTSWPFEFGTDQAVGKEWVSMILSAQAQNKKLRIGYNANPNGKCAIEYLYFYE